MIFLNLFQESWRADFGYGGSTNDFDYRLNHNHNHILNALREWGQGAKHCPAGNDFNNPTAWIALMSIDSECPLILHSKPEDQENLWKGLSFIMEDGLFNLLHLYTLKAQLNSIRAERDPTTNIKIWGGNFQAANKTQIFCTKEGSSKGGKKTQEQSRRDFGMSSLEKARWDHRGSDIFEEGASKGGKKTQEQSRRDFGTNSFDKIMWDYRDSGIFEEGASKGGLAHAVVARAQRAERQVNYNAGVTSEAGTTMTFWKKPLATQNQVGHAFDRKSEIIPGELHEFWSSYDVSQIPGDPSAELLASRNGKETHSRPRQLCLIFAPTEDHIHYNSETGDVSLASLLPSKLDERVPI